MQTLLQKKNKWVCEVNPKANAFDPFKSRGFLKVFQLTLSDICRSNNKKNIEKRKFDRSSIRWGFPTARMEFFSFFSYFRDFYNSLSLIHCIFLSIYVREVWISIIFLKNRFLEKFFFKFNGYWTFLKINIWLKQVFSKNFICRKFQNSYLNN